MYEHRADNKENREDNQTDYHCTVEDLKNLDL